MHRRLPPLLFLLAALALAAPAGADAAMQRFEVAGPADGATSPKAALRRAQAAVSGRSEADVTPLLKELAVALPRLKGGDRRRARRVLARPVIGETSASETPYQVPEHSPPHCTVHFCIHWVDTTVDAPPSADTGGVAGVPDYVETMGGVFEDVYQFENVRLGWRAPTPDGGAGCPPGGGDCMNKTDVYIQEVGGRSIYGYAAPDPGQRSLSQAAYLVMDNDYSIQQFPKYQGNVLPPMQVTAAHEYNHVLQFGYDVAQDIWMLEATATWMEDKVYTDVNDYVQYLGPWAQLSFVPLTQFSPQDDPTNVKVYGDAVWNRWVDTTFGEDIPRIAWENSQRSTPSSFAPGAYDLALRQRGSTFFNAFTRFAADTAEWRASNSPFAEGATFPDMTRVRDVNSGEVITLSIDRGAAGGQLPHLTFGLVEVEPTSVPRVKMVMNVGRGVQAALALVGRTGDETGGRSTVVLKRLPNGGSGTVTLQNPGQFSRITAVIINGDGRTTGRFSRTLQDWEWIGDGARVTSRLSTDFTAPAVRSRSPRAGATDVSPRARVRIGFSEAVARLDSGSVVLIGPGGKKVKVRVLRRRGGRAVEMRPRRRLAEGRKYQVRLGSAIEDRGGNHLPKSARKWSFRTAR
jgi:hypothetical protein